MSDEPRYSQRDLERQKRDWEESELVKRLDKGFSGVESALERHAADDSRHLGLGQAKLLEALLRREGRQAILFGSGRSLLVTLAAIIGALSLLATLVYDLTHLAAAR